MPHHPIDILQSLKTRQGLIAKTEGLASDIAVAAVRMSDCLRNGGVIYACGNGGSATQAQHFAAELVGRFKMDRTALRAFALNDNPAVVTSLANDYDYTEIYARQLQGIGRDGDCLLALTTSGTSPNVVRACATAHENGMYVVTLTGKSGGAAADNSDITIRVADNDTARIQEIHLVVIHLLCEYIEASLFTAGSSKSLNRSDDIS